MSLPVSQSQVARDAELEEGGARCPIVSGPTQGICPHPSLPFFGARFAQQSGRNSGQTQVGSATQCPSEWSLGLNEAWVVILETWGEPTSTRIPLAIKLWISILSRLYDDKHEGEI